MEKSLHLTKNVRQFFIIQNMMPILPEVKDRGFSKLSRKNVLGRTLETGETSRRTMKRRSSEDRSNKEETIELSRMENKQCM